LEVERKLKLYPLLKVFAIGDDRKEDSHDVSASQFWGKGKIKAKRNVLKRYERVRYLQEKGNGTRRSPFWGLPKITVKD